MDVFTAIGDPTRRRIIESLAGTERSAGAIAADFTISAPAVSQHLKVLRDCGLVQVRNDAQRRLYRLDDERLGEIEDWTRRVRRFWEPRLDALSAELDKDNLMKKEKEQ
ncbi:MAG: metalloregulator ArsR/SmtB family transcription factor [Pseudomonadota bacterium]